MKTERSGAIGRILADRPMTTATVFAVGLIAAAYLGVDGAQPGAAAPQDIARVLLGFIALPALPLALAAFAPRTRYGAGLSLLGAAVAAFALSRALPLSAPDLPRPDNRFFGVGLLLFGALLALRPAIGLAIRFCFIGAASAVLGVAGAAGLMTKSGADAATIAAFGALGVALAAAVSVNVAADFSAFFARGADPRRAAISSSEHALGPVALAVALGFISVSLHGLFAGGVAGARLAWTSALAAALATGIAAAASTGAVALSAADEGLAVDENMRRQRLRRLWRPLRQALSANVAYAACAIAFVVLLVIAFDLKAPPRAAALIYAPLAGIIAGASLISLRSGLFVVAQLTAATLSTAWIFERVGRPLDQLGSAVASAILAVSFAMLALAWRDARSPRLNARETMEATLTDGAGRFAVSLAAAAGALYAAAFTGVWPGGVDAAARVLVGGFVGILTGPALMTALSAIGGRDGA